MKANIPDKQWMQYMDPAEAGYDVGQLQAAQQYWQGISSSAFMVVVDGKVLVAWGDIGRRFMIHSVRKSFLAGLYGIYWDRREIDLNKTLADLGIDDHPLPLLESERQARILDLLKARSGVLHPSAYGNYKHPVPRGSQGPGRYYAYNNWDFNTLGAIFEQETGKSIFDAFEEHFAVPLGMEDWRLSDGYYHYERDKSRYPAYPFRLSSRDAARIGLLFARNGMWGEQQILSKYWIQRATAIYSDALETEGYGFMWWIHTEPRFAKYGMYSALGVGTQMIAALPELDMVVVNRANTFERNTTPPHLLKNLIEKIINARTGPAAAKPRLKPLAASWDRYAVGVENPVLREYAGTWDYPPTPLGLPTVAKVTFQPADDHLFARFSNTGNFRMYLQEDGSFHQEDSLLRYIPIVDEDGRQQGLADSRDLVRAAVAAHATDDRDASDDFLALASEHDRQIGRAVMTVLKGNKKLAARQLSKVADTVSEAYVINVLRMSSEELFTREQTSQGLSVLALSTAVYADSFAPWFQLAQTHFALGNLAEATKAVQKSLAINVESPDAKLLLRRIEKQRAEK